MEKQSILQFYIVIALAYHYLIMVEDCLLSQSRTGVLMGFLNLYSSSCVFVICCWWYAVYIDANLIIFGWSRETRSIKHSFQYHLTLPITCTCMLGTSNIALYTSMYTDGPWWTVVVMLRYDDLQLLLSDFLSHYISTSTPSWINNAGNYTA